HMSASDPKRTSRAWLLSIFMVFERSRGLSVRVLPTGVRIGFGACCRVTERGIIHAKLGGVTVGRIVRGSLRRDPQTAICEDLTQNRSDDFFPVARILRCPPMADAVVTATIFQQHLPSMLAIECDGEGDPGILCMFDA